MYKILANTTHFDFTGVLSQAYPELKEALTTTSVRSSDFLVGSTLPYLEAHHIGALKQAIEFDTFLSHSILLRYPKMFVPSLERAFQWISQQAKFSTQPKLAGEIKAMCHDLMQTYLDCVLVLHNANELIDRYGLNVLLDTGHKPEDLPKSHDIRTQLHSTLKSFTMIVRSLWDKLMNTLILMHGSEKDFKTLEGAKSKKKTFDTLANTLKLPPDFLVMIQNAVVHLDEQFRTPEVHASGRLRKDVFSDHSFSSPYIALSHHWHFVEHAFTLIDRIFTNTFSAEASKKESAEVFYNYASCLHGLEEEFNRFGKESLPMCEIALKLNPDFVDALSLKATLLVSKGDLVNLESGLVCLDKAIEIDRNRADLYIKRASVYLVKGEIKRFRVNVNVASGLDPKCHWAQLDPGAIHIIEEMEFWTKRLEKEPTNSAYRYNRGLCYSQANRWKDAEADFQICLDKDNLCTQAIRQLVHVLASQDNYEAAMQHANKLLEYLPNDDEAWYARGMVNQLYLKSTDIRLSYLFKNDPELKLSIRIFGHDPSHLKLRYENSRADLLHAIELSPHHLAAWESLAILENQCERYEVSVSLLSHTIQIAHQEFPRLFYNRGWAYLKLGALPEAKADFEKVIALVPSDGDALSFLGDIASKMGDANKALEYYFDACYHSPESKACFDKLCEYLRTQGHVVRPNPISEIHGQPLPIHWHHAVGLIGAAAQAFQLNRLEIAITFSEKAVFIAHDCIQISYFDSFYKWKRDYSILKDQIVKQNFSDFSRAQLTEFVTKFEQLGKSVEGALANENRLFEPILKGNVHWMLYQLYSELDQQDKALQSLLIASECGHQAARLTGAL